MDSVRFGFYCPVGEPGYHMPYLRAARERAFERHGLDVELLEPAEGTANIHRVADGGADFCLTSLAYFVKAHATRPDLPARFAAVITRRNPMAAIVLEESTVRELADLAGIRVGGRGHGGLVTEYCGALAHLGIPEPTVVPVDYFDAPAALRDGAIGVMGDFVDLQPKIRRIAGPIRALPFGIDVYQSGLIAADRLPLDVVQRMRDAVVEAISVHASSPELGVKPLLQRYPDVNADDALESWHLIEPLIVTDAAVGAMTAEGWQRSLAYASAVHGVEQPPVGAAYRPKLLSAPEPVA